MKNKPKKPLFTPDELEVSLYDPVEFLDSDEAIAGHLSISLLEDYEPDLFLGAIGNALRAKGLNTIESLLKIAEEMRPPVDSTDLPRTRTKSVRKTAERKNAAKKPSSHPKTRKKREAAVA